MDERNTVSRHCAEETMQMAAGLVRKCVPAALAVSLSLCIPGLAAAASVSIDDLTDTLSMATDVSANVAITQEGIGIQGGADLHFEYFSSDPNVPAPGAVLVSNYNIYGCEGSPVCQNGLSDTLGITLAGHAPGADPSNVSVDLHFRSDSTDEMAPVALVNASDMTETGQYQIVDAGLTDLIVQFRSDISEVPLPPAAWLFGSGLLGLVGVARRKAA